MGIDKISGRGPGEAKLYRKKFLTKNLTPTRGELSVRFSYILLFAILFTQESLVSSYDRSSFKNQFSPTGQGPVECRDGE